MALQLLRQDDPRGPLEKATRHELYEFARRRGVETVKPGMPANLMRRMLRQSGHTDITIPKRVLGQYGNPGYQRQSDQPEPDHSNGAEMDADALLAAQWEAENARTAADDFAEPYTPGYQDMTMPMLRRICSERGLGFVRTDKKIELIERLREADDGQDAA